MTVRAEIKLQKLTKFELGVETHPHEGGIVSNRK